MIVDVPSSQDFFDSGIELFDFAWDTVAALLTNLAQAEEWGIDPVEVSEEYWAAAKRRLTTALAMTQQGVEFILKGKIAEISPYLLLAEGPSKWPSPYGDCKPNFSEFKTVDALPDDTGLGAILRAFLGYQDEPTVLEVVAYVGYFVVVWLLSKTNITRQPVRAATEAPRTA